MRYVLVAGVNGAGKSTLYSMEFSIQGIEKINLDETVRNIGDWRNPEDVTRAGLIVVKKIKECFERRQSFCQETTLCGHGILNIIKKARELGYHIELHYVGLESAELAKDRVRYRVSRGGHGIPDKDIERRYEESLHNLRKIVSICDQVTIYDNTTQMKIVAMYESGECIVQDNNVPEWFRNTMILSED